MVTCRRTDVDRGEQDRDHVGGLRVAALIHLGVSVRFLLGERDAVHRTDVITAERDRERRVAGIGIGRRRRVVGAAGRKRRRAEHRADEMLNAHTETVQCDGRCAKGLRDRSFLNWDDAACRQRITAPLDRSRPAPYYPPRAAGRHSEDAYLRGRPMGAVGMRVPPIPPMPPMPPPYTPFTSPPIG